VSPDAKAEDLAEAARGPGHYCGLFGVFDTDHAAAMVHLGLQALQHRGQESAGIAAAHGEQLLCERGGGLVTQALGREQVLGLPGRIAVGHVRYATTGGPDPRNAQPLLVHYRGGPVALAHNGDLTNKALLREEGERAGATFFTASDTETIVNLLARADGDSFTDSLHRTLARLEGAFSLVILRPGEIHAVRDPHGFRPLSLGRLPEGGWVVSSETCAFPLVGAEHLRDLAPGEHVILTRSGLESFRFAPSGRLAQCVFEHIYFARPDSRLFGETVHVVRARLGERLAEEHPAPADIVVAVPESGTSAAQGFSRRSGIPLDKGFVKNHYVGRTFLKPSPEARRSSVLLKLAPVPEVVGGRSIVVVDDSIVRGTTSLGRIRSLRQAGAREIHLRISCPPVTWPCFYGIDFPTREELIAARHSVAEMQRYLEVDSLGFTSLEGLLASVRGGADSFCTACFTGEYPTPIPPGALPAPCR
jgi:amidophosphoribosyltransferase